MLHMTKNTHDKFLEVLHESSVKEASPGKQVKKVFNFSSFIKKAQKAAETIDDQYANSHSTTIHREPRTHGYSH